MIKYFLNESLPCQKLAAPVVRNLSQPRIHHCHFGWGLGAFTVLRGGQRGETVTQSWVLHCQGGYGGGLR